MDKDLFLFFDHHCHSITCNVGVVDTETLVIMLRNYDANFFERFSDEELHEGLEDFAAPDLLETGW